MKKLKINTSLLNLWMNGHMNHMCVIPIFENVCIEQNLDNVTINDVNLASVDLKNCNFSFIECMDIIF